MFSKSDKNRFEEIREKIEKAIARLNLAATVEAAAIAKAQFKQSAELRERVEELGGFEKVAGDPALVKQVEETMSASDRLLNAGIQETKRTLKTVGDQVRRGLGAMKSLQEETQQAQQAMLLQATRAADTQESTAQQLETMTRSFMGMKRDAELAKLRGTVLQDTVDELKAMIGEMRDCATLFPVPASEPERVAVLDAGGLMAMSPSDRAFPELQRVVKEAAERWDLACLLNLIGGRTIYTAAAYVPRSAAKAAGIAADLDAEGIALDSYASDLCGVAAPRKVSACQHVVGSGKPLRFAGMASPEAPAFASPEALAKLARFDPVMRGYFESMAQGVLPHARDAELLHAESPAVITKWFMAMAGDPSNFYCGVPCEVEGEVVGSLCVMGGGVAADAFAEGSPEMRGLLALAARAGRAMEAQLEARRREEAQKEVMVGMLDFQRAQWRAQQDRFKAIMGMAEGGMVHVGHHAVVGAGGGGGG